MDYLVKGKHRSYIVYYYEKRVRVFQTKIDHICMPQLEWAEGK